MRTLNISFLNSYGLTRIHRLIIVNFKKTQLVLIKMLELSLPYQLTTKINVAFTCAFYDDMEQSCILKGKSRNELVLIVPNPTSAGNTLHSKWKKRVWLHLELL